VKSLTVVVLLALLVIGCNPLSLILSGPSWVGTYKNSPLAFSVPADSSDAVWSRARTWFGGYTTPELDSATDSMMRSAVTKSSTGAYTITISRTPDGGKVVFEVKYDLSGTEPQRAADRAKDRAHELAYMTATADNQQAFIHRNTP
jgi:hypothetical protein